MITIFNVFHAWDRHLTVRVAANMRSARALLWPPYQCKTGHWSLVQMRTSACFVELSSLPKAMLIYGRLGDVFWCHWTPLPPANRPNTKQWFHLPKKTIVNGQGMFQAHLFHLDHLAFAPSSPPSDQKSFSRGPNSCESGASTKRDGPSCFACLDKSGYMLGFLGSA